MNRYVFDTNHSFTLLNLAAPLWNRLKANATDDFFLCQPSICELWFMVFNSARIAENQKNLESLLATYPTLELNARAAMEYGRVRAELRVIGRPIPQIDTQIAAIARTNDLTVLTADAHFSFVSGLRRENWMSP
jgi:tRNA(fMet)-specific endonuclease VapC